MRRKGFFSPLLSWLDYLKISINSVNKLFFREAFAIVRMEIGQRAIMPDQNVIDGSALVTVQPKATVVTTIG